MYNNIGAIFLFLACVSNVNFCWLLKD